MLGATVTTKDSLIALAEQKASAYGVDPNLVKAIIQQESAWNIQAYRYEPKLNDASIGLMQILLNTAKMISGNQSLTEQDLYNPATNIDIGTKYLAQLKGRYWNWNDIISAYNGGSALLSKAGGYVNQDYVDGVNKYYAMFANLGGGGAVAADLYSSITGGADAGADQPTMLIVIAAGILAVDILGVFKKGRRRR